MSPNQPLSTHRSWEDIAIAALGLGVMAVTWEHSRDVVPGGQVPAELINTAVIGVLLLILGLYEIAETSRVIEYCVLACGLWLIASPMVLGFMGQSNFAMWHYALGSAVTALSALELWQDWDLSAEQMTRHSR